MCILIKHVPTNELLYTTGSNLIMLLICFFQKEEQKRLLIHLWENHQPWSQISLSAIILKALTTAALMMAQMMIHIMTDYDTNWQD